MNTDLSKRPAEELPMSPCAQVEVGGQMRVIGRPSGLELFRLRIQGVCPTSQKRNLLDLVPRPLYQRR